MVMTLPESDAEFAPPPEPPPDPSGPPIPLTRPAIADEAVAAAAAVVRTGWMAEGPAVAAFEEAFADLVRAEHAIALANGTSPLHLALVVLGVRPGDDVVVPAFSHAGTTSAVLDVGARPAFADVDIETGCLSAATVGAALTERTRAVIVVHQNGVPADLDPIHALCGRRGVAVVEDASSALGATYGDRLVGAHSDFVTFSFDPLQLVTTGEGGMVTTSSEEWADRLRGLREHGVSLRLGRLGRHLGLPIEGYVETGFTGRMTDIQGALGLAQLEDLDELVLRRRELAVRYQDAFADISGLRCMGDPRHGTTNYQRFWILLDDWFPLRRDELMQWLAEYDIASAPNVRAAHLEPDCSRFANRALPVTERLASQSLVLPLFHDLTEADQDRVIDAVGLALTQRAQ
jgi:dTDP-4-amino-4,6-dideoxygalactose transaminase